jgi:hypothetical protein
LTKITGFIQVLIFKIGLTKALRLSDGTILTDLSQPIFTAINNKNENIILMLQDDYEDYLEQNKLKKNFAKVGKSISPNK